MKRASPTTPLFRIDDPSEFVYACDRCGCDMSAIAYSLQQLNRGVCRGCEDTMPTLKETATTILDALREDIDKYGHAPIWVRAIELYGEAMYGAGKEAGLLRAGEIMDESVKESEEIA